ncbi:MULTISPECIES: RNA polymerase sigma factor SigX [Aneurinibacillus]|uniref:RNA polymerase sigma factor SigX n=1 Tax=Aneurinibacillus thermoaerophilus TaxID=143495 RepID=A0A1G8ADH8_ANETH|nr:MULTISPECIES: RNA polymerase sigma factor SigX [Aneurinibacillus]AMA73495.1 RNA polymerase subunit sigma [Aneurinibacillus sp. XH2]MED0676723.1 RNA polymerase sigma factor SigX [Aneurinibacillus thermoaerophilus]MED0680008.1 RNA polymerase sigma factor SigX [Aneurinibacillus thermoaerophilus]MED0738475.1 RNA polymerase sigma factor SigX [Aneurinibacillus thermoaerophilus]MED0756117.1 RNA polymerase sigma factor SigX [Aneurinibacillus thermoaerophilus]
MEVRATLIKKQTSSAASDNFKDLFKAYYPYVVWQIMRIIKDQSQAEDIAQEVFLQLYHTDRTVIQNIPAWLTKAAIYAAYNSLRSEKRRTARDKKQNIEAETYSPSSEEKWFQQEEIASVRQVLMNMEERERTLLLMKYSGFTYKELAQAVNVEQSSVGTLLARAKTKFRNMYKHIRGYAE